MYFSFTNFGVVYHEDYFFLVFRTKKTTTDFTILMTIIKTWNIISSLSYDYIRHKETTIRNRVKINMWVVIE